MNEQELITALKFGKLHIDCVSMEAVQNKSDAPAKYTGKGYVYQDDDGVVSFKLYVDAVENAVIAHPGMGSGWVSKAVRMAVSTATRLALAVLTTERKAA
jgi:hypothetical protein